MTRSSHIDITEAQRRIVLDALRAHVPTGAVVWVFGSRAAGRARRYSDLDLAIDAGRRLTLDETAILAEAFSDSDLPYRVDVVDWQSIDDRFREVIAADAIVLAIPSDTPAADRPSPGGKVTQ